MAADVVHAVDVHRALALGAGAQRLLAAEVDGFGLLVLGIVLAEVEFQLVFRGDLEDGREGPAHLAAETRQRADDLVLQQRLDLGQLELAATRDLGDGEVALAAGKALVVLLDDTTAGRAGGLQHGIVAGHRVGLEVAGLLHDVAGHGGNVRHEDLAVHAALLELAELVFPVAGEFRHAERSHAQAAQQREQLEGLGGGDELAPFAQQVAFGDQPLDDGGAGGWRAQALAGHGLTQLVVVDQLAGAFHGREQRGLGVAGRRPGLVGLQGDLVGLHRFVGLDGHQVAGAVATAGVTTVDGQPAGVDQHAPFGLEGVTGHGGDAGGDQVFGRRVEHGHEAAHHQVVDLLLGIRQVLGSLQRGDDGEVVGDLAVVEDPLVGLDPVLFQDGAGKFAVHAGFGELAQRLAHRAQVVLGQRPRIGTRVGEHLVLFVQRLGQCQGGLGREAEAAVGLALQRGQVKECRGDLGGRFGFFRDGAGLALAGSHDGLGVLAGPEAVGLVLGIVALLEVAIEPLAFVLAGLGAEGGLDLEVVARHEAADLLFAFDHHGQRGGLHPADGGEVEAAIARVEGRHGAGAVDAHQPVGLGAAARRVGQAVQLVALAQLGKAFTDGVGRHRLQPQPLHGLLGLGVLHDQPEDQFALAARVTGVDQRGDILALDQLGELLEAVVRLLDRLQIEMRRDDRKVSERPLPSLDIVLLGCSDLHQVAHRRAEHVVVIFEVVAVTDETPQRPRDVGGDGRFLGNDQSFTHGGAIVRGRLRIRQVAAFRKGDFRYQSSRCQRPSTWRPM